MDPILKDLVWFIAGSISTWLLVFLHDFTRMESAMREEDRNELEALRRKHNQERPDDLRVKKSTRTMLDLRED